MNDVTLIEVLFAHVHIQGNKCDTISFFVQHCVFPLFPPITVASENSETSSSFFLLSDRQAGTQQLYGIFPDFQAQHTWYNSNHTVKNYAMARQDIMH